MQMNVFSVGIVRLFPRRVQRKNVEKRQFHIHNALIDSKSSTNNRRLCVYLPVLRHDPTSHNYKRKYLILKLFIETQHKIKKNTNTVIQGGQLVEST